ncbi:hypothetical protein BLEM_0597 [Bifidobacterium lemurum]|uniref:Helix-turn-helix domain-containing protein n=1 Tax=Bifidobacterium lemurum TaxID=1603886 RepID=A0A261FU22_9BIFI|nr:helix-turn-helix domain-containing protein [Bifidobacterium lemurum]OZG62680.1 hypothetical protein BLEM_0597 [Bifidobacterium lemurum]QOL34603.1 helix-turn-helix domain-containing protein [Bifidobacterium lemurum]
MASSYLTRAEVARLLNVSVATFDRMRADGRFDVHPAMWGGVRLYYLKSDVIGWMGRNRK